MNVKKQFMDGMFYQNPVTVQLLGMCSTMALSLIHIWGWCRCPANPCRWPR